MDKSVVAAINETILSGSDIEQARTAVRAFGRLVFAEEVGYANLPRTCTVLRVVSPRYTVRIEELRDGSRDVREVLRSAVHDVAMETRRRGTGDVLVTYPEIYMRVEAGMLETFAEVFIVTPNNAAQVQKPPVCWQGADGTRYEIRVDFPNTPMECRSLVCTCACGHVHLPLDNRVVRVTEIECSCGRHIEVDWSGLANNAAVARKPPQAAGSED